MKNISTEPKIYSPDEHPIRHHHIDPNALTVIKRLQKAGYIAYLVGGGVRDLLLGKKPKDFDISTSALPEDIKQLFRNSLLIGRRFRLAHIRFGKQIIEVSTFRSGDPEDEELIVRDNLWGTPQEDVLRRDFTFNGLFYDPTDQTIIDYVGGYEDLKRHTLCCIGAPDIRFKQDPVRMIRLQKFRARFGFNVQTEALIALENCREEIKKSSPARVLEEIFRMLESGASEDFFRLLVESKLLHILFKDLSQYFESEMSETLFHYLKGVDSMNTRGHYKTLDRSLLTAALIFPIIERVVLDHPDKPLHLTQIMELTMQLIEELLFKPFHHFPRKLRQLALSIIVLQYRLTPLTKRRPIKSRLVKQKLFLPALTFLKLRALVHPPLFKTYESWKKIYKDEHPEDA
jgi:poly(A) polymerase